MTGIYILAGQSNMVGSGVTAELPERHRQTPETIRLWEDGQFVPFTRSPRFGPEVGFAYELGVALPGDPVVLGKVAKSGANLTYDWNPDGVSRGEEDDYRGPMYPLMLDQVRQLCDSLRAEGDDATISGMAWMQGERDSVFDSMAAAYEDNLTAFIKQVRKDLQTPSLPFAVAQICPRVINLDTGRYRHAYREQVRQAQQAVAESLSSVALVRTDDLPQSDNLHFDTAGQIELGRRLARACVNMMTAPTDRGVA